MLSHSAARCTPETLAHRASQWSLGQQTEQDIAIGYMLSHATEGRVDYIKLAEEVRGWAQTLGFQQLGIAEVDLSEDEVRLCNWLNAGRHGAMQYLAQHRAMRTRPRQLFPRTLRVLSVRMNYWPKMACDAKEVLADPRLGYIARYALGRDYHKVLRKRLQQLAQRIEQRIGPFGYRVFVDSAPVLEKALARNAGLGWIGKHTNLISRQNGSWFFLGELFTDLPLPPSKPASAHCGTCSACVHACPTSALVAPYQLDARRCISYLTIELRASIPPELRPLMGNRIFGCDDCQLVCPWNRFGQQTLETDFFPRNELDAPRLIKLFSWNETEFNQRTEGSPIRRVGYLGWLRNIAVALGNARTSLELVQVLRSRVNHPSTLVQEHVIWALAQHERANATNRR